jgi:hypothetical protein
MKPLPNEGATLEGGPERVKDTTRRKGIMEPLKHGGMRNADNRNALRASS